MPAWRWLLVTVAAICSVLCSCVLAWYATTLVRGANYSDVGVIMYERRSMALAVGVLAFPVLSGVLLLTIRRTLSKESDLPYWVGIPVAGLCLIFYLPLLLWAYG
jgi:hypothetical protein